MEHILLEKIRDDLLELGEGELTLESNLIEAGLDSMAIMQLLLLIEETFGVTLDAGDMTEENLSSIPALAALIQREKEGDL